MNAENFLDAALEYAGHGWSVFPLRGKSPAIANPHPKGSPERHACKRECGSDGHGVLDASSDLGRVARWWARYPRANIGGRVPEGVFVLDVDPRHGGDTRLADLEAAHSVLPETLRSLSGRGDGGTHHYFRHPGGKFRSPGHGLDVKTAAGYVVLPPSLHPATGCPYTWVEVAAPIVAARDWLIELLRPPVAEPPRRPRIPSPWALTHHDETPADFFTRTTRWADVLTGWTLKGGDGDTDGSTWRHPTATSPASATTRHGLLFVYTTNTPLPVTETGSPNGLTKFRAYSILEHDGDLRAAASAVRTLMPPKGTR